VRHGSEQFRIPVECFGEAGNIDGCPSGQGSILEAVLWPIRASILWVVASLAIRARDRDFGKTLLELCVACDSSLLLLTIHMSYQMLIVAERVLCIVLKCGYV